MRELPDLFSGAPFSDLDTSLEAAHAIEPHLARLESMVLEAIRSRGEYGACCHEVEQLTGLPHTTTSARIRGLVLKELVTWRKDFACRLTPAGRRAKVWVLA